MNNFTYYAPTKVFFGKGVLSNIGVELKKLGVKKALLHYGTSPKKLGTIDNITASLKEAGIAFVEKGGVEPNPKSGLVDETADMCRSEGVDFILAVGGGSAIDSAKAIAHCLANNAACWDIMTGKVPITASTPVGVVLTLAAAGSEMSNSVVISNSELGLKKGIGNDLNRPVIAFCDPQLTYTVNKYNTACGVVDIMMHTMERYYTGDPVCEPTDRIAEAVLLSVKEAGTVVMNDPENYEARATIMWASSLSHNGLTNCGKDYKILTVHQLEHALSGKFDRVAHGAGLAVLYPAWAKLVYKVDEARFARLAEKIWGIPSGTENAAYLGILAMEDYFKSLGMPVTLRELEVYEDSFEELTSMVSNGGRNTIPGNMSLGEKEVLEIFELAK